MQDITQTAPIVDLSPPVTDSEPYKANERHNAEIIKNIDRRPTLGELEDQLRNIEENIALRESQEAECEQNIALLERQQKTAEDILKELEGQVGIQVRADRTLAQETLDKVPPRLALERERLDRIVGILKQWRERLHAFPVADLKKRQVDANRVARLKGSRRLHF